MTLRWFGLTMVLCLAFVGCMPRAPRASQSAADTSPCHMPMGWSFDGPCASGAISRNGTRITAPPYHGLRVEVDFGPADSDGAPFVVAIATGAGDITGRLNNALPFPRYGSVACAAVNRRSVPCDGAALLYLLVVDAGQAVTFSRGVTLRVVRNRPFPPGTRCRWNTLAPDRSAISGVAYIAHPPVVRARARMLVLGPPPGPQAYGGGGHVVAFAVTCAG